MRRLQRGPLTATEAEEVYALRLKLEPETIDIAAKLAGTAEQQAASICSISSTA